MIVTCPACSSRYRIRDEKIKGRGARISCPKCEHKFVVHRQEESLPVGGEARGVPVTFARGGQPQRRDFVEEDDEADVPTTVMPHGSQLTESIRAAAAAEAQRLAEAREALAGGGRLDAASLQDYARHREGAPQEGEVDARQLRAQGQRAAPVAEGSRGRGILRVVLVVLILGLGLVAAAAYSGLLPLPQAGGF